MNFAIASRIFVRRFLNTSSVLKTSTSLVKGMKIPFPVALTKRPFHASAFTASDQLFLVRFYKLIFF
jgi:hypothetical protein